VNIAASSPPLHNITAAILAGGRGTRLGGADKGLEVLAGRPLIASISMALERQSSALIVNANRNLERYRAMGFVVVTDADDAFRGPLAGMLSVLRAATTEYVLCVPCDAPLLPADLTARLWHALNTAGAAASVAHNQDGIQPVYTLLSITLADALEDALTGGTRKVADWLRSIGAVGADFSDHPAMFLNLNCAADRSSLLAQMETSSHPLMPPVLGFVGYSGAGKTTLLKQLLPLLRARGLRVGMVKHAHHDFDIDTPGKDSYELRKAGAEQMLVASARRWALMAENGDDREPLLGKLIQRMDWATLDLILVEGFKHEPIAKIEVHRAVLGKPLLYPHDAQVIALATENITVTQRPLAVLNINNVVQIAEFVCARYRIESKKQGVTQ